MNMKSTCIIYWVQQTLILPSIKKIIMVAQPKMPDEL